MPKLLLIMYHFSQSAFCCRSYMLLCLKISIPAPVPSSPLKILLSCSYWAANREKVAEYGTDACAAFEGVPNRDTVAHLKNKANALMHQKGRKWRLLREYGENYYFSSPAYFWLLTIKETDSRAGCVLLQCWYKGIMIVTTPQQWECVVFCGSQWNLTGTFKKFKKKR